MNSSYVFLQRTFRVLSGLIGLKNHGVGPTVLTIATHSSSWLPTSISFAGVSDIIQQTGRIDYIVT